MFLYCVGPEKFMMDKSPKVTHAVVLPGTGSVGYETFDQARDAVDDMPHAIVQSAGPMICPAIKIGRVYPEMIKCN